MKNYKLYLLIMVVIALNLHLPTYAKVSTEDIVGVGLLFLNDDIAEKIIGEIGSSAFEKEYGILENPQENAQILNIGTKLVQYVSRPKVKYQFKTTNNSEVNACAIPGGHIYVNKGLLHCPGLTEDELAFCLAHEITHIDKRHSLKQMKSNLPLSVLTGQIKKEDTKRVADIALNIYTAGRSRIDEKEADCEGFKLLVKAGYDPTASLAFMRRLETLSKKNPNLFERLFMTHPPTHDRAEALKDALIEEVTGTNYRTLSDENIVQLPVKFLPQAQPGQWKHNMNCGPASLVMAACYVKNETPTPEKILEIDRFLGLNAKGSNGTECDDLVKAAKGVFGLENIAKDRFDIERIKHEVEAGRPVIVAVTAKALPNRGYKYQGGHFVVAIGFDNDSIICHDPGTSKGAAKKYRSEDFKKAMQLQANAVVYGFQKEISGPEPNQPESSKPPVIQPRDKIEIEKGPQHLGDDTPDSKVIWMKEFELNKEDLADRKEAIVRLRVMGTPNKDPIISFNRQKVGYAVTKTGVWEWFSFSFKPDILRPGKNLIDIETLIPNLYQTFDDCEFADVTLLLK